MGAIDRPLRSGELARLTGVSSDTIRYYERMGVLPIAPRAASGYRMFAPEAVERVRLVRRALQMGFALTELSEFLRARDSGKAPCHRVLNLAEEKLHSLELRIYELRQTQRYMRELIRHWRVQLSKTAPGSKALLLESLKDEPALRMKSSDNLRRRKQK